MIHQRTKFTELSVSNRLSTSKGFPNKLMGKEEIRPIFAANKQLPVMPFHRWVTEGSLEVSHCNYGSDGLMQIILVASEIEILRLLHCRRRLRITVL